MLNAYMINMRLIGGKMKKIILCVLLSFMFAVVVRIFRDISRIECW